MQANREGYALQDVQTRLDVLRIAAFSGREMNFELLCVHCYHIVSRNGAMSIGSSRLSIKPASWGAIVSPSNHECIKHVRCVSLPCMTGQKLGYPIDQSRIWIDEQTVSLHIRF